MSDETILPCPFCGGEVEVSETESLNNWRKYVGCMTEGCQGYQSAVTFATRREAIQAWNKRDERLSGYARTVRLDRQIIQDETVMCLQTKDWCEGLLELANAHTANASP